MQLTGHPAGQICGLTSLQTYSNHWDRYSFTFGAIWRQSERFFSSWFSGIFSCVKWRWCDVISCAWRNPPPPQSGGSPQHAELSNQIHGKRSFYHLDLRLILPTLHRYLTNKRVNPPSSPIKSEKRAREPHCNTGASKMLILKLIPDLGMDFIKFWLISIKMHPESRSAQKLKMTLTLIFSMEFWGTKRRDLNHHRMNCNVHRSDKGHWEIRWDNILLQFIIPTDMTLWSRQHVNFDRQEGRWKKQRHSSKAMFYFAGSHLWFQQKKTRGLWNISTIITSKIGIQLCLKDNMSKR